MFAAAVILVGAASAAMVAAVKIAADRVVAAVEKVEEAVYSYSDAVMAAEMRQDKAAGCRSDVARHIVQALVQFNRAHSALWLQRRLQSAMESAVRAAATVGAERQLYWRMQAFEAKLQIIRDLLVEPLDEERRNGVANLAALQQNSVQLFAEWQDLQNNQALQHFAMLPMRMQIEDRLAEIRSLMQDHEGVSGKLAAIQKCREIL